MHTVLHVSASGERAGLEAIVRHLVLDLDRSRYAPIVALLQDGPFAEELRGLDVETHVVPAGRVRELMRGRRAIGTLIELIRRRSVSLVHTHNAKAHCYGGWAARLAGARCLFHLHGAPRAAASADGLVSLLAMLAPADLTVACSHYVAEAFGRAWPFARPARVVHNGVPAPRDQGDRPGDGIRGELGIGQDEPMVVVACRLQRVKGVHVFVEAAARLADAWPEARFVVVGGALLGLDPEYPAELEDLARRLGVAHRITFTGYRQDAHRFLAAADIVVHSAVGPDSFPTVILEAMSHGKPVVATDCGGPPEMVVPGVTGFLVPPARPDALAEALATLASPERRRVFGEAGARRARNLFTAERMTRAMEGLYHQILGGSGARS